MMGLAGMTLPFRPLGGVCVPEGVFLVDAVIQAAPRRKLAEPPLPWWAVAERLRWTIDLFERLEQRERV